jgi:hypothetical protein
MLFYGRACASEDYRIQRAEIESGVSRVKTALMIPDYELWLHEPSVKRNLDRAIAWAEHNPTKATNLGEFGKRIEQLRFRTVHADHDTASKKK